VHVDRRTDCDGSLLPETHLMLSQYQTVRSHCVTRHTEADQIVGGTRREQLAARVAEKVMRTGF